MDITELRSAHQAFFDAIARGPFRAPAGGSWRAELIVAHVYANTALLTSAVEAVLAGTPHSYDNARVIDANRLLAVVGFGGLTDVTGLARIQTERLERVASMLSPELEQTIIVAKVVDGTTVRVDGPVPIAGFVRANARVHLPAHIEQLRALSVNSGTAVAV